MAEEFKLSWSELFFFSPSPLKTSGYPSNTLGLVLLVAWLEIQKVDLTLGFTSKTSLLTLYLETLHSQKEGASSLKDIML